MKQLLSIFILLISLQVTAQPDRWQQSVAYTMDINMDVKKHQFTGTQHLVYFNNSPDTLTEVYYHLYFNAFQPGSMMDVRSRNIADPDSRVGDRIFHLKADEIGYQKIKTLTQDGQPVNYEVVGTILEVSLDKPILPNSQTVFDMTFEAQVPLQIRRSGRDNEEGIDYSMAQWYPKMSEYDYMGWHPNPYIGREFHGIWGSFEVNITIDPCYIIGGTGYLQNANEIGHGYQEDGLKVKKQKEDVTWRFKADKIMDFVWTADPDYTVTKKQVPDGPLLYFVYQKNKETEGSWAQLPDYMVKTFQYMSNRFGKYPYKQYSFIQGGDGGMEYPMATLVTGNRKLSSLVSVSVHEGIHSWYQHLLGTNESLYCWMDEGFTVYASNETKSFLYNDKKDRHQGSFKGYKQLVESGNEEPSSLHADHFNTNWAYGTAAYSKGNLFLHQLSYIVGMEAFDKGMKKYFNTWKFKHPNPNDFIRIMEKESGMVLDWYLNYWINTTKTVDYGIKSVVSDGSKTSITLERIGEIPMPIDLQVTYKNGKTALYYIPLKIMRGEKPSEDSNITRIVKKDWAWTNPTYTFEIDNKEGEISEIKIDPSARMADIVKDNNLYRIEN